MPRQIKSAKPGLRPQMGCNGLIELEILRSGREAGEHGRQVDGFGVRGGDLGCRHAQPPAGKPAQEQLQHRTHFLELDASLPVAIPLDEGGERFKRRGRWVQTPLVVDVHGADQPLLRALWPQQGQGLGCQCRELIGKLRVAFGDHGDPM